MTNRNEFESRSPSSIAVQDFFTINQLFFAWLHIGFTSFGGGAITQYLIQESFIYKHKWITAEEYANIIAMCQITPGINIIAYTILIGKRLAGWPGIFVSVMGLILPSALITIGISAIYTRISEFSKVQAVLRAVFAAIFGIALATNWRNVRPILVSNYKRGLWTFLVTIGIMISSAMIYILLNPPVVLLYLLGGLCGALTYWYVAKKKREDE
ncbi:chromate transporter [Sporomusaceae bacterium BoRhaA]|uniref:chromate transporter n=1 Tax=Pelorhabdus rhamnosifermentans TaxID=2772457 RepID=UPI001C062E99|nr:chromate transporter [Pelorhabdus rhamnosifermentans]MBU2700493.1 chromate transporter [Pelorhabdus rhamnosifermentans]